MISLFYDFQILLYELLNKDCNHLFYDMLNAKFGWSLTGDDVTSLGKRVLTTEVDFNRRAGIGEALDRLPDFFMDEKLPPHETTFDFTDKELQETLNFVK